MPILSPPLCAWTSNPSTSNPSETDDTPKRAGKSNLKVTRKGRSSVPTSANYQISTQDDESDHDDWADGEREREEGGRAGGSNVGASGK